MKQSDIFTIILVAGIGVIGSFFICNALMGSPKDAKVEFVALKKPITSELMTPDPEVFNSSAINPTIEVYVGDCEDLDQNGILDETELESCGRIEAAQEENGGQDGGGEQPEG